MMGEGSTSSSTIHESDCGCDWLWVQGSAFVCDSTDWCRISHGIVPYSHILTRVSYCVNITTRRLANSRKEHQVGKLLVFTFETTIPITLGHGSCLKNVKKTLNVNIFVTRIWIVRDSLWWYPSYSIVIWNKNLQYFWAKSPLVSRMVWLSGPLFRENDRNSLMVNTCVCKVNHTLKQLPRFRSFDAFGNYCFAYYIILYWIICLLPLFSLLYTLLAYTQTETWPSHQSDNGLHSFKYMYAILTFTWFTHTELRRSGNILDFNGILKKSIEICKTLANNDSRLNYIMLPMKRVIIPSTKLK